MESITEMQSRFLTIQNELKNKIVCKDTFDANSVRTVAGVDLAYWKDENNNEQAVCCIVVIDMLTHDIIEKKHFSGRIEVPYIPGFLAFRELPLVLGTSELLDNKPDIYAFRWQRVSSPKAYGHCVSRIVLSQCADYRRCKDIFPCG